MREFIVVISPRAERRDDERCNSVVAGDSSRNRRRSALSPLLRGTPCPPASPVAPEYAVSPPPQDRPLRPERRDPSPGMPDPDPGCSQSPWPEPAQGRAESCGNDGAEASAKSVTRRVASKLRPGDPRSLDPLRLRAPIRTSARCRSCDSCDAETQPQGRRQGT